MTLHNSSNDKRNTFIIVTEKDKLNDSLLSSLDLCDFVDSFSLSSNQGIFNITILSVLDCEVSILNKHLYDSFDLNENLGRCLIIEWLHKEPTFEIYGIHPHKDKSIKYGVASRFPLSDKSVFIDTIKGRETYSSRIEVSSSFFRASLFYSDLCDELLDEFKEREYWKYF